MMESLKSFNARVLERTGQELNAIPTGTPDDLLGGSIFCRRGTTYVVGIGYPEDREDGEYYHEFRVVSL